VHGTAREAQRIVAIDLNTSQPEPPAPDDPPPAAPQTQQLAVTVQPPIDTPVIAPMPPVVLSTSAPIPAVVHIAPQAPVAPAAPAVAPPAPPSIVSADDLGTRMISGRPPRYPVQSRRHREQGVVELLLIVAFDGAVETISVSRSSGFARLDEAALDAVRRWRWEPTLRNGAPVKVRGVVEIPFQLEG
jgi:protein TonB